jgi:hypothetical protein
MYAVRLLPTLVILLLTAAMVRADDRAPVPDADAQAKAEKLIKDLFKADYAKRRASDWQELASKLLQQADETMDDPTSRFVLLREARDLAARAGDTDLALRAIGELSKNYVIDAPDMKANALEKVAVQTAGVRTNQALAEAALAACGEAVEADNYDAAVRLLKVAENAARKCRSTNLTTLAQNRRKDMELVQREAEGVKKHLKTLEKDPKDPDANVEVGKFLCLLKGNWEKGLPLLAQQSADETLRDLAKKDLAAPTQPNDQVEVGDGWWALAGSETGLAKWQLQKRADTWYKQAAPDLTGITKSRIDKRIKEVETLALSRGEIPTIYTKVQAAVKAGKTKDSRHMGTGDIPFRSVSQGGSILVGFDVGYGQFVGNPVIHALRPIFQTPRGKVYGRVYGVATAGMDHVEAKPGYAVGAITVKAGLGIDGLSVTFMEIEGDGLNRNKSYETKWLGGMGGGPKTKLAGDGAFVVGIFGKLTKDLKAINGLGIVTVTTAKTD